MALMQKDDISLKLTELMGFAWHIFLGRPSTTVCTVHWNPMISVDCDIFDENTKVSKVEKDISRIIKLYSLPMKREDIEYLELARELIRDLVELHLFYDHLRRAVFDSLLFRIRSPAAWAGQKSEGRPMLQERIELAIILSETWDKKMRNNLNGGDERDKFYKFSSSVVKMFKVKTISPIGDLIDVITSRMNYYEDHEIAMFDTHTRAKIRSRLLPPMAIADLGERNIRHAVKQIKQYKESFRNFEVDAQGLGESKKKKHYYSDIGKDIRNHSIKHINQSQRRRLAIMAMMIEAEDVELM